MIVGAGTAGCVLANRLSADPGVSVLLLEAGGKDDYFWIDIPVGYLYTINNPRTDWCYKTEPDARAERPRHRLCARQGAGRLLVDQRHDLHARPEGATTTTGPHSGNRGWSWDEVLPYFKRIEDYQHGADELHGAGGELRVEERRVQLGDPRRLARCRRRNAASRRSPSSTAATTSATPISR